MREEDRGKARGRKRTLEDRSMAPLEKGKEYMTLPTKNGLCWRELNRKQCGSRTVTRLKKENESVLACLVLRILIEHLLARRF